MLPEFAEVTMREAFRRLPEGIGWGLEPVGGIWDDEEEEPPHPENIEEAARALTPLRSLRRVSCKIAD
jgi:hypothetical protein